MSNMSYCRFENTYKDLKEAYQYIEDDASISETEYRRKLIELCKRIANDFED